MFEATRAKVESRIEREIGELIVLLSSANDSEGCARALEQANSRLKRITEQELKGERLRIAAKALTEEIRRRVDDLIVQQGSLKPHFDSVMRPLSVFQLIYERRNEGGGVALTRYPAAVNALKDLKQAVADERHILEAIEEREKIIREFIDRLKRTS